MQYCNKKCSELDDVYNLFIFSNIISDVKDVQFIHDSCMIIELLSVP